MNKKSSCPVCSSSNFDDFLTKKNVLVHQNLLFSNKKDALKAGRAEMNYAVCKSCGFVFNRFFDSSKLKYGEEYEPTQDASPYFDTYLSNLAKNLVFENKVQHCNIVEIGCGKGTFLRRLVKDKDWKNTGYGFDPSYVGPETDLEGRLIFKKRFFDNNYTNINPDVIICRHVIEHIHDPITFLKTVRMAINTPNNASVFFETPNIDWTFTNEIIYDFSYEHCSLFSQNSIKTAFESSGFEVKNVKLVFNDQYLWVEAKPSSTLTITKNPSNTPILARKFGELENELKNKWQNRIIEFSKNGGVAIWGAGGKGATFVNLMDPDHNWIDSVIDLNPNKQGGYMAGTGHLIISYKQMVDRKIKKIILMNPNYYDEVLSILNKSNLNIDLIRY